MSNNASVSPSTTIESGASAPPIWWYIVALLDSPINRLAITAFWCGVDEAAVIGAETKRILRDRPGYVIASIAAYPVPDGVGGAKQPSTTDADAATGERSSTGGTNQ